MKRVKLVLLDSLLCLFFLTNNSSSCCHAQANLDAACGQVENQLRMGNLDSAVKLADRVIISNPNSDKALCLKGLALKRQKHYEKSVEALSQAIRINASNVNALLYRGESYFELGDEKLARIDLDRAIVLKPDFVDAHVSRAMVLTTLGKFDGAVDDLLVCRRLRPARAEYLEKLGFVYGVKQDYLKSIEMYDRAIQIDPTSISAYLQRAAAYSMAGKNNEALADYAHVLQVRPHDLESTYRRVEIFEKTNQADKALTELGKVLTYKPRDGEPLLRRARLAFKFARYQIAIKDCDTLLALSPLDDEVFFLRGQSLMRSSSYEKAITDFSKCLALDPANASVVLKERAAAYVKTGHLDLAKADLSKARSVDERNSKF